MVKGKGISRRDLASLSLSGISVVISMVVSASLLSSSHARVREDALIAVVFASIALVAMIWLLVTRRIAS